MFKNFFINNRFMKKKILSFVLLLLSYHVFAQNVGVGTTSPLARLHVADSSVLFFAPGVAGLSPGNPPISGAGRRMMWYPDKGAFRAGYVPGTEWDKTNIGDYSFATGFGNKAYGNFSTATGGGTTANGAYSLTSGYITIATGSVATALGAYTNAKALGAISLGVLNDDTDNPDPINPSYSDRIFQVGNGDINTLTRNNALTILRNGYIGMGTTLPGSPLHIKTNYINPMIIDGGDQMYVTLAENGNYKGYIGSFYGNPDDIDFGTYYGSTAAVHLTTNNSTPRLTVIHNGNIGVGTTTPASLLHIKQGSAGGNVPAGLLSVESSNNAYISLLTSDANESGIIFGKNSNNISGGIYYNSSGNANGLQFNTNGTANRMVISSTGNVGIGLTNPGYPLNFAATLGDKISLWGNSGNHYGFGINNGLLQVYTDGSGSDVAFGYGTSGTFTEKFRMKGNGALVINGSAGSTGQVLQSNGPSASPSWNNPSSALYNNMTEYAQSSTVTMNNPGPGSSYTIPGMSGISFVIPSLSKVIFSGTINTSRDACGGCGSIERSISVQLTSPFVFIASGADFLSPLETATLTTGMKFMTLGPGTYTVDCLIFNASGGSGTASSGRLNVIIIPQ